MSCWCTCSSTRCGCVGRYTTRLKLTSPCIILSIRKKSINSKFYYRRLKDFFFLNKFLPDEMTYNYTDAIDLLFYNSSVSIVGMLAIHPSDCSRPLSKHYQLATFVIHVMDCCWSIAYYRRTVWMCDVVSTLD